MIVNVTPLLSKGEDRQRWMLWMGQVRGTLVVKDCRDTHNQRMTRVAELTQTDDVYGRSWILYDVQLTKMNGSLFDLSGYERIVGWNGVAKNFFQTWRVHFLQPQSTMSPPGADGKTPDSASPTEESSSSVAVR